MAREYPRFIFSNPKNTKSKGPFIVHTLEPRCIGRVEIIQSEIHIIPLDAWDVNIDYCGGVFFEMRKWIKIQIASGEITL